MTHFELPPGQSAEAGGPARLPMFENFREAGEEAAKAARVMGQIAEHAQLLMKRFEAGEMGIQCTPDSRTMSWLLRKLLGNLPTVTITIVKKTP